MSVTTIRRWKQLAIEAALGEGAHEAEVEDRHGAHLRLVLRHRGTKRTVFLSRTPSDHRAIANLRRDVRKVMREMERRA